MTQQERRCRRRYHTCVICWTRSSLDKLSSNGRCHSVSTVNWWGFLGKNCYLLCRVDIFPSSLQIFKINFRLKTFSKEKHLSSFIRTFKHFPVKRFLSNQNNEQWTSTNLEVESCSHSQFSGGGLKLSQKKVQGEKRKLLKFKVHHRALIPRAEKANSLRDVTPAWEFLSAKVFRGEYKRGLRLQKQQQHSIERVKWRIFQSRPYSDIHHEQDIMRDVFRR